jgi:hypothetical protein
MQLAPDEYKIPNNLHKLMRREKRRNKKAICNTMSMIKSQRYIFHSQIS